MTCRVADGSLISVIRLKRSVIRENIHGLLKQPVDVLVVWATRPVVLACQQIVECRNIDRIAIGLQKRAIVVAVHGKFRMAVCVATIDLVSLALAGDLIVPHTRYVRRLSRRQVVEVQLRLGSRP